MFKGVLEKYRSLGIFLEFLNYLGSVIKFDYLLAYVGFMGSCKLSILDGR
jgi:hypothetical protein